MGRWKNTPPRDIPWTAAKVSEAVALSARRAKLECVDQAMECARSYDAANNRIDRAKAEALREFAERLIR